ncbi:MAG: penicillin-binding transpeptidase domain-containing protein, partial [Psychrobacillus psychrotolerans]
LAAAIEEGVWAPNATYKSGSYKIFDRTIRDHNVVGWGNITYLEGFQRSSNVSMAYLLNQIGEETFNEYIKLFGFGQKTGIDLPSEATGIIANAGPVERITTTYGQGTTVTPIQMVQGMTAIANEGKMMQPFIIDKIVNPNTNDVVENHKEAEKKSPISAETAQQVKEILASTVTSEKGTAQKFKLNGYTSAGKTGTAQISKPGGGYYWGRNDFLYSFLGMAPVEDPQLIVYVMVHRPNLEMTETGSDTTSEIFNAVTERSLKYLNIEPENLELAKSIEMPNVVGEDLMASQSKLEAQGLKTVVIGQSDKVEEQYPAAKTSAISNSIVFLKGQGDIQLPDFKGWSKRNIMIYKSLSKLPIEIVGEGFVNEQSLTGGSIVTADTPIVVKLATPAEVTNNKGNLDESQTDLPQD